MSKKILILKPPHGYIPIGIAYVLGCLKREGIPFDFFDMFRFPEVELENVLRQSDYFAIGTGGLVTDFPNIRNVIGECKRIRPNIPIVLGGNITNDLPADYLFKWLSIDYAVLGEAETSLPRLLRTIAGDIKSLGACRGIIYKEPESGQPLRRPPVRLSLEDEDPLPAYEYIDVDYYLNNWEHGTFGKLRAMPVLTGRGCKGSCSFCSPTLGRFRARKIENVLAEIESYSERYAPEVFVFQNEIMFERAQQIKRFCKAYRQQPYAKPWICLLRADVDPAVLTEMKAAGCIGLNVGIESGSDKILTLMRKGVTVAQTTRFLRAVRKAGIITEASAMLASEGETPEDLRATIDLFINEDILFPAIQLTVAYPGTRIYKKAVDKRLIEDEHHYLKNINSAFINPADMFSVYGTDYVNISDIPGDRFWMTIFKEFRRYTTHMYRRCSAVGIKQTGAKIGPDALMSGQCPACKQTLNISCINYDNMLNLNVRCPECKIIVFFNPFELDDMKSHIDALNRQFAHSKRPLIFGANANARALLLYGLLDIPFDKLQGFVDPSKRFVAHLYYFRGLSVDEMKKLSPDFILNVQSIHLPTTLTSDGVGVEYLIPEKFRT
jgi:radical SAM superfamily enzyme YgiQ (UPF0313 family)